MRERTEPKKRLRVLVVDDKESVRDLLRDILEHGGYDVILAGGGEEALELASREQPDLVLLDILMPKMTGWDVLRDLRRSSQVPVIMLTALGDRSLMIQALDEEQADAYLVKPISRLDLLTRIGFVMRRFPR